MSKVVAVVTNPVHVSVDSRDSIVRGDALIDVPNHTVTLTDTEGRVVFSRNYFGGSVLSRISQSFASVLPTADAPVAPRQFALTIGPDHEFWAALVGNR